MNNVIDEVLAGEPTYQLTYNDNTTATGVKIELETAVTTAGTPLNKALFDSIQTDLNTRLLISNKATTAEAQEGTNDTKYMTPLKTRQALNYLTTNINIPATSSSSSVTETLFTFDNSSNAIIRIDGLIGYPTRGAGTSISYYPQIAINGTGIYTTLMSNITFSNNGTAYEIYLGNSDSTSATSSRDRIPFWAEFNMATKTWKGEFFRANYASTFVYSHIQVSGWFSSLTNVTLAHRGTIPIVATVTEIV